MPSLRSVVLLLAGAGAVGALGWLAGTRTEKAAERPPVRDDGADPAAAFSAPRSSSRSPAAATANFAERWAEAGNMADAGRRRTIRAALLAEWLTADYEAGFAFLRAEKFAPLSLPGIAALIAKRGDLHDLLLIAHEAELTFDALQAIGAALSPEQLAAFAEATHRLPPPRQAEAAGAVAASLAQRNLDAALAYAAGVPDPHAQANAYAAVADALTFKQAAGEARAVIESLPESIQNTDALRFALGNALRDTAPEAALASYGDIADPQTRRMALVSFSRSIEARAPGAAMQAIFAAGLSAEGAMNHASRITRTWAVLDATAAREFVTGASWLTPEQRQQLEPHLRGPASTP